MRVVLISSILGFGWNLLALVLVGSSYGTSARPFHPAWLAAGLVAGLTAGAFTVWTSRNIRKSALREFLSTIATYYLAVCTWWVTVGLGLTLVGLADPGATTGDALRFLAVHLEIGHIVLLLATLYGLVFVPLCRLSMLLVRSQMERCLPQTGAI